MRLRHTIAFLATLGVLQPDPLRAQTIIGQVIEKNSGAPVPAGFVALIGADGQEIARALSNNDGRFVLRTREPGVYTVRSERIGFRASTSAPISLDRGERKHYQMEVEAIPVTLESIVVSGETECRSRPEEGRASATLWEEARKALTAVAWLRTQRRFRVDMRLWERRLDTLLRVVRESTQTHTGMARRPFRSLHPSDLTTRGYVRSRRDGGYDFWGPDADVLFSDAFVSEHCFRIVPGLTEETVGHLGLSFEPVGRREVSDIEGVMWLDDQNAELRHVDFRYTNLELPAWTDDVGGRIEFLRLANGAWIVRRYFIRMPIIEWVNEREFRNLRMWVDSRRPKVVGFKEDGGEILDAFGANLLRLASAEGATLIGMVYDSTRSTPLIGATVFLRGTKYQTTSGGGGRFRMDGVPEGTYAVEFAHPDIPAWGVLPGVDAVSLKRSASTSVRLAVPSRAGLVKLLCADLPVERRAGAVAGVVRDIGSRNPVAGAMVQVSWSNWELRNIRNQTATSAQILQTRLRVETFADSTGYYLACNVPANQPVEAWAVLGERLGITSTLRVVPGELAEQDLLLEPPRNSGGGRGR